jgi:hypothetical protein
MEMVVETQEFAQTLDALLGESLWDVVAGETTGSNVLFKFGRRFRARDVYTKPTPSEEDIFVGELELMVWCSWRIETGEARLLCGCGDLHNEGGPMLTGLQKLVGDTVAEVSLGPFLDLLIVLSSRRKLRLFCDRKEDDLEWAHYSLTTVYEHERVLYAALDGVITRERLPRGQRRSNEAQ